MQALREGPLARNAGERLQVSERLQQIYDGAAAFNCVTISQALSSPPGQQTATSLYLFDAPSKRIRLHFANGIAGCLLSLRGLGDAEIEGRLREISPWVSALEMVHTSSLYHDDVLDGAATRRGVPAAHHAFPFINVTVAPYHIISSCQKINQPFGDNRLLELIHDMISDLEQGERAQEEAKRAQSFDAQTAFEAYLQKNFLKTGSIFVRGTEGVCRLVGADPALGDALLRAACLAGVAFQVRDDVLDYTSDAKGLFKDFNEGIITLPVLELMRMQGSEAAQRFFAKQMQPQELTSPALLAACEQFVGRCFDEFLRCLQPLESAHLRFLSAVCHKMFYRKT